MYFIIGLDGKNILFYDELMIKFTSPINEGKKTQEIKRKDMALFAKREFNALVKKHISISIHLYTL